MAKRKKKGSWIVVAECTVTKEFVCENCTEEEARENPTAFAEDETELDCIDVVRVNSVTLND